MLTPQPLWATTRQMFQSLNPLHVPSLHPVDYAMSFLSWRAQNWTQHSHCGFTSAEQMGIISSLALLAMLFLMQPRMLLALFQDIFLQIQQNFKDMISFLFPGPITSQESKNCIILLINLLCPYQGLHLHSCYIFPK